MDQPGNPSASGIVTGEQVDILLTRPGLRIERIVSRGHVTPPGQCYDQSEDEWVMVTSGAARLWLADRGEVTLGPGDHLLIPAHCRHRVVWTDPHCDTVWTAIFIAPAGEKCGRAPSAPL